MYIYNVANGLIISITFIKLTQVNQGTFVASFLTETF